MKKFTKLLIAVILCLNSLLSVAQQGDTLEIQRTENGNISFARFKPDVNRKIQDGATFLKVVRSSREDDEFRLYSNATICNINMSLDKILL